MQSWLRPRHDLGTQSKTLDGPVNPPIKSGEGHVAEIKATIQSEIILHNLATARGRVTASAADSARAA
jgi:hypothetical protein